MQKNAPLSICCRVSEINQPHLASLHQNVAGTQVAVCNTCCMHGPKGCQCSITHRLIAARAQGNRTLKILRGQEIAVPTHARAMSHKVWHKHPLEALEARIHCCLMLQQLLQAWSHSCLDGDSHGRSRALASAARHGSSKTTQTGTRAR